MIRSVAGSASDNLGTLNPIPAPISNPILDLEGLLGVSLPSDQLTFHCVGDSGGSDTQSIEAVAEAMEGDAKLGIDAKFFFHLGDVVYGANKDQEYLDRFYRPYDAYPGPIIAIPGNHDGETKASTDPTSLAAFWANFCSREAQLPVDVGQTGMARKTMTQPGVYFLARCPLMDLIALYSNTGESAGTLSDGHDDQQQIEFLGSALAAVAKDRAAGQRRALLLATHHPPFSSSGHSGSFAMLDQIDTACDAAGIYPDIVLSGHAHNYQRYTRTFSFGGGSISVPFLVAGTGGYGLQAIGAPLGSTHEVERGSVVYNNAVKSHGYLLISVTPGQITVTMRTVTPDGTTADFDTVTVSLS
jgi:predicted phosphodiesterase